MRGRLALGPHKEKTETRETRIPVDKPQCPQSRRPLIPWGLRPGCMSRRGPAESDRPSGNTTLGIPDIVQSRRPSWELELWDLQINAGFGVGALFVAFFRAFVSRLPGLSYGKKKKNWSGRKGPVNGTGKTQPGNELPRATRPKRTATATSRPPELEPENFSGKLTLKVQS